MARNGSGSYSLPEAALTNGTTADATVVQSNFDDIATALTGSLAKDGQTVPTANLPMGGYKHTGVADGSARTQYATLGQLQDGAPFYAAAGGTADVITLTIAPAITAYAIGQTFWIKTGAGANTGAVTLNINGLGAGAVKWPDDTALVAGDLPASAMIEVTCQAVTPVFHLMSGVRVGGLLKSGGTMTGTLVMSGAAINQAKGADIASATTTDIGAATGNYVDVTGTTTITGLGTVQAGTERKVRFTGALTLTHNATSLILPGAANITTASGDVADFVSLGSGNWRCTSYVRGTGFLGDLGGVLTTQGDVLTRDGTSPTRLAAGRSGKVLTTGGAGATPSWTAAGALAFVRFVGSSGAIVGTAFNVSSVTRNSAGNYTVNFSPVLPSANYSIIATGARPAGNSLCSVFVDGGTAPTTSAVVLIGVLMNSGDSTISAGDPTHVSVAVYDAT